MRKIQSVVCFACLGLLGCDDSNNSAQVCELDCGHGVCEIRVTQELCICDLGYHGDRCSLPDDPRLVLNQKPELDGTKVKFSVQLVDVANKIDRPTLVIKKDGSILTNVMGKSYELTDDMGNAKKAAYSVEVLLNNEIEPIYIPVWREETPWDWRNAVIYFAFIDRFNNGNTSNDHPLNVANDWKGGDFAGLKQKVDEGYFDALGVNTLWLSSVSMNTQKAFGNASAYHSYWPITTGYTEKTQNIFYNQYSNNVQITPIEPHFGTMDELKALIDSCHSRGMRVLVDFAVNHVADDSPVYALHPDWFNHVNVADRDSILCEGPHDSQANWNIIPETCWFSDNLPDFNYEIPEVRKFVIDHAKWLVRTTGVDGFRLDAVKHMPVSVITNLRSGMDELYQYSDSNNPFYIVGETFDGADKIRQYIGATMLHGQFDFPLYNVLRDTVMNGDGLFYNLKDFVVNNDTAYGDALMSTFLGNHDVARAISHIHHDSELKTAVNPEVMDTWAYRQLRLAWVFLMTSPMLPLIYYGDEFGLEGANDPDNRRMMKFGDALNPEQKKTLELVQKLGQLRHKHPALWRGKRQNVDAYERSYMYVMRDENETILIGINDSDLPQNYDLVQWGIPEGANGWIDLLNENQPVTETTTVSLTAERQIIVWKAK